MARRNLIPPPARPLPDASTPPRPVPGPSRTVPAGRNAVVTGVIRRRDGGRWATVVFIRSTAFPGRYVGDRAAVVLGQALEQGVQSGRRRRRDRSTRVGLAPRRSGGSAGRRRARTSRPGRTRLRAGDSTTASPFPSGVNPSTKTCSRGPSAGRDTTPGASGSGISPAVGPTPSPRACGPGTTTGGRRTCSSSPHNRTRGSCTTKRASASRSTGIGWTR